MGGHTNEHTLFAASPLLLRRVTEILETSIYFVVNVPLCSPKEAI